jgi:Cu(I)/Ag(I) efflux system membrane protein CusA/SilA
MITAPLLSMFVIPAAWFLLQRRRVRRAARARHDLSPTSGTTVPVISTGDNR